ncbi:MAG: 4Fe-4S binding protein [Terriglobia bacterium]
MIREGKKSWLVHNLTHRGVTAVVLTAIIVAFYLVLYYTDVFTSAARAIGLGDKWTLYGILYTAAVVIGGIHVLHKYRRDRYQIVRTSVVMFVQITLAFALPEIMMFFHRPGYYFSYLWPLKLEDFAPNDIFRLPLPYILYSFMGSLLMVPLLGIFLGKRWYCSWVCGCGGLANTAGDPLRHLTSKSSASWKFERVSIYVVLVVCIVLTATLFITWGAGDRYAGLHHFAARFQSLYGLLVVAVLSGIVGAGFYPLGGTRIWCRNFCPMAAVLGLVQKFGRYRITVKDNMCISCGLCSKYCEMGIDVRSYAQTNTSFVRASCVGCGICANVCPRGVLRLENATRPHPQEIALIQISSPAAKVAI